MIVRAGGLGFVQSVSLSSGQILVIIHVFFTPFGGGAEGVLSEHDKSRRDCAVESSTVTACQR
jgi:hypothetical protein